MQFTGLLIVNGKFIYEIGKYLIVKDPYWSNLRMLFVRRLWKAVREIKRYLKKLGSTCWYAR